jgi:hypothetical protein
MRRFGFGSVSQRRRDGAAFWAVAAFVFLWADPVRAASADAGTRVAGILASQPGARPRGMGNAFTAVPGDINALVVNPAGLGTLTHREVTAMHRESIGGITHDYAGYVLPLDMGSAENLRDLGVVGFHGGFVDYGSLENRGVTGAGQGSFDARDSMLGLTYGKHLTQQLTLGGTAKLYRLRIAEQRAEGSAFDTGVLYSFLSGRGAVGAALLNWGGEVSYTGTGEGLPQAFSAGLSLTPVQDVTLVALDLVNPADDDLGYRAGFEWWFTDLLAARAGYDSTYEPGHLALGLGIRIQSLEVAFFPIHRLLLDYSFTPSGDFDNLHNISLSLRFGDQ